MQKYFLNRISPNFLRQKTVIRPFYQFSQIRHFSNKGIPKAGYHLHGENQEEIAFDKNGKEIVQGEDIRKTTKFKLIKHGTILSRLNTRSVISVSGLDASELLQNVMTNDIRLFNKDGPKRAAISTAFLNAKGKVIMDAIVVKPRLGGQNNEQTREYWIDVNKEKDAKTLIRHLKKYSLRKQVEIHDISELIQPFQINTTMQLADNQSDLDGVMRQCKPGHFYQTLQDGIEMQESEDFPGQMETDVACFVDPRTPWLGVRILCNQESLLLDDPEFVPLDHDDEYHMLRNLYGIPEGSKELGNTLPLNMNLQYLNMLSFDKGCYIGQELTNRTKFTGVIRRVALPYIVHPRNKAMEFNASNFNPLYQVDGQFDTQKYVLTGQQAMSNCDPPQKVAKIMSQHYNSGVALVDVAKLSKIDKQDLLWLGDDKDLRIFIWQPNWLDDGMQEELLKEAHHDTNELMDEIATEDNQGLKDDGVDMSQAKFGMRGDENDPYKDFTNEQIDAMKKGQKIIDIDPEDLKK